MYQSVCFCLFCADQTADNGAAQQKSGRCRNPGVTGRDAAPARRRRLPLLRLYGFFRAEYHTQMIDSQSPQLFAHDPGQRTSEGFGDVRNLQKGRVQFVSGSQRGNHGDAQTQGRLDQIQLARDQINGVHNIVIPAALPEKRCRFSA